MRGKNSIVLRLSSIVTDTLFQISVLTASYALLIHHLGETL